MKILWASNAPWAPSGYGGQTLQVVRRLKAAGHDIAIAANYGVQGMVIQHEAMPDVPVFPAMYDGIGNDILPAHYMAWAKDEPTYLITLYDVWPYQRDRFKDIPIASWVPVDHYPAPPVVVAWCLEHEPIAMSRFGQQRLTDGMLLHHAREIDPKGTMDRDERMRRANEALDASGRRPAYIPHAVERSVFHPIEDARAKMEWPDDAFVVTINAANKGGINSPMRKAWSEMFGAMAMFMDAHPDVKLHLHTERIGGGAPDLQQIIDAWHIDSARITWTSQYQMKIGQVEPSDLALMYSASDVLLATSKGEGFGIPVIEAQACGLPVIVSNWTAQPELVGGGWLVDVQPDWDTAQGAYFCTPIISSIVARLEDAYAARGDEAIRQAAIDKAAEYDADKVFAESWVPYIASLEERLRPPNRAERRAKRRKAA